jgi:tetratricopeptide (TPR) repeat protein
VNVVNIERRKDESEGAALQRFLLRLWNRMLDFDIYLNPEPREVSYANSLQIAIGSYRQASYHSADHLFEKLESAPKSVWSADPGLFAQYSYFKLKTLDKLNRWAEMEQAGQKLLAMLGGFDTVYPDPVLQSIRAQIHASIGLPLLRASFFEKAQSYILQALGTDPDDSIIGKDAMLLHADRHTVLACIELGLYLFGEEQDLGNLTAAERYLVKAGDLFRTYDDPDGPNEAHFLGRYFGACAFLRMVKVRYGGLPFSEPLSEELCQYSWMSYREIREGKNRVAYGKLAGHYCEAVTKSFLAGERLRTGDRAGAETLYAHSIKILEGLLAATDETVQICLSPLESCKFHRALELALRGLASMGTPELADRVTLHHDHFRQFASSEELRFMNAQVLAHESWILTPLN